MSGRDFPESVAGTYRNQRSGFTGTGGRDYPEWVVDLPRNMHVTAQAAGAGNIKVFLDGRQLSFPVPPLVEKGTVLVPLRAIFEALDATVT